MESRGQKRAEEAEELPADKRACSSHEFRASSSNSTWLNSENPNPVRDDNVSNADMDTSSSASASGSRSEEEAERDSGYGSCDSDDDMDQRHSSLRAFQRRRLSDDHNRLKSALGSLSEGTDPSAQLVSLTELCEVLSFCTEGSLSGGMVESLAPVLVRLAKHESNPEIMLLAIRALTYLCDVFPRASASLVRHEAIPALCDRLLAIEYLDVAEQCLQALEKISREQPHVCLQAGAIMAVLGFIDFFSTSIQRVALSTVVNICKKLPADDCASHFMVAVPTLCNLLQYEDRQLVESVAICLIKIAERVGQSSESLDELCRHGLVSQAVRLIHLSSLTTLSLPIYNGLIGVLYKLSSGSILALGTLHDLNICCILKDILAASDLSRGMSTTNVIDVQSNQVHEVLKLLNELLPNPVRDQEVNLQLQLSNKELYFADHPDLLPKIVLDVLPTLIQVVYSGANMYVCYGCLSVIYKLIHFSNSDMLLEMTNANIPSFLAGVLIRKDHHVLILALRIAETILQKYPDSFINTFMKEGVFSAIDVLTTQQKCSLSMFPKFNAIPLPSDSSHKIVSKVSLRCLCYAFDTDQSPPSSETGICMLEKDCVQNLATHIRNRYFAQELKDSRKGFTDTFQDLKALSAKLSDVMHFTAIKIGSLTLDCEQLSYILPEIIKKLDGKEHVSTFEFIGSGTAKSLVNYVSNGRYLVGNGSFCDRGEDDWIVEKRFENFGKLVLSSMGYPELPLVNLVRKLQSALSSLENFPVVLSSQVSQRNSFAAVPHGRYTSHACLRVCFKRLEGEIGLGEFSHDILTVDPFSSFDEIEQFLFPKVRINGTEKVEVPAEPLVPTDAKRFKTLTDVNTDKAKITDLPALDSMSTDMPNMQENEVYISHSSLDRVENSNVSHTPVPISENKSHTATPLQVIQLSSEQETDMSNLNLASLSNIDPAPKMLFYLEDKQLDRRATLYQAILQQKLVTEPETDTSLKFWSQVYVLRYGKATKCNDVEPGEQPRVSSPLSDKLRMHHSLFFSGMFDSELSSILDPSSSTYDIVWLLKSLERLNRFSFHLMSCERMHAFAEGIIDNLDGLKVVVPSVSQNEFMNCKLTEKLEQQMRDQLAVSVGGMPLWCSKLMGSCPFLFSFETKSKYFRLSAFGPPQVQRHPSRHIDQGGSRDRRPSPGGSPRKKFLACRERILESAAKMMDLYVSAKLPIEVVYNDEVGTGLGPTLEFFTLVSHEFQKSGIGMWRGDHDPSTTNQLIMSPFGLFPRPWTSASETSRGIQFVDVMNKFVLLGQVVAKALQDGRFLDLPFSKAFYKLILQQELNLHDIQSFDPELGKTLVEFQALVYRKKHVESSFANRSSSCPPETRFRDSRIEELCLNFSLPGYPEHLLGSHDANKMVNLENLNEYVALTVDATLCSGIYRQVEAFKRGFNQVFPITYLSIFTEEELERLLCGEHDFSDFNELVDHIKFDHGYTVSSRPIIHLIEVLREFNYEQRRAFLQFITGAPRLPPGGLASLNPKLTIVRKHSSSCADEDLPSVMTCANYLKLPPYSSKEKMKEKLIYAITEGQGSFHLS